MSSTDEGKPQGLFNEVRKKRPTNISTEREVGHMNKENQPPAVNTPPAPKPTDTPKQPYSAAAVVFTR